MSSKLGLFKNLKPLIISHHIGYLNSWRINTYNTLYKPDILTNSNKTVSWLNHLLFYCFLNPMLMWTISSSLENMEIRSTHSYWRKPKYAKITQQTYAKYWIAKLGWVTNKRYACWNITTQKHHLLQTPCFSSAFYVIDPFL